MNRSTNEALADALDEPPGTVPVTLTLFASYSMTVTLSRLIIVSPNLINTEYPPRLELRTHDITGAESVTQSVNMLFGAETVIKAKPKIT